MRGGEEKRETVFGKEERTMENIIGRGEDYGCREDRLGFTPEGRHALAKQDRENSTWETCMFWFC